LFWQTVFELLLFGVFWGAAWAFSRASIDDLFLRWRGIWENVILGLAYSIGLRFVLLGAMVLVIAVALMSGITSDQITNFVKSFSPTPDRMVSSKALGSDPLYLFLMVTWVSFVVAGLREELWRVGVIAACTKLLTPRFSARSAQIFAVVMSSLFFGMAHYIQGWLAVGMTAIVGMSLGAITLMHRSIWPAVIAHGAFDALTFLMLPLASGVKLPHS
jgi:membrane protease YdiL (CAAX protease family)